MAKMLRRTLKFGIFLMLAACLALPAMAAGGNLADVEIGGTTIHLNALNAGKLSLRVSGPGDFAYEATSKGGEGFVFEIFDAAGGLLPDGTYKYELTALGAKPKAAEPENLRGLMGSEAARKQWGAFTIRNGALVEPGLEEPIERPAQKADRQAVPTKDEVFVDDVIVEASLCVGFDCVNGENFGADTIRLKENNLRIHFDDTSNSGSFPANDWRIVANDSTNGGANYLAIEDSTAGRIPFRVEAGARVNALVVESDGDIGIGTLNPAVDLEIVTGNTPTLRLQQDGSSGFTAQTWDVAGNETNFFVRDVTNGSLLPFRIRPSAPTNSIYIDTDGDVGMGTASPSNHLHVLETATAATRIRVENNNATAQNTAVAIENSAADWDLRVNSQGNFLIARNGSGITELLIDDTNGNVTLGGSLIITGNCTDGNGGNGTPDDCDGVFQPDYPVPSIEEHAAFMWENSYLPAVGPTPAGSPWNLNQKAAGMLNELEKAHIYIEQLHKTIQELESRIEKIESGSN